MLSLELGPELDLLAHRSWWPSLGVNDQAFD